MFPSSNRLVATWIPSQERGLANGFIFAGVGAGAGIAPPLVTRIMLRYGWRGGSFWMSAAISAWRPAASGIGWRATGRRTMFRGSWPGEVAHIEKGLPEPPAQLEIGKALPWRTIFGSKDVAAIAFSYFAYGYAAWIFFAWFFIYLSKVRGLDLKSSSYYGALPFLAMATCSRWADASANAPTRRYGKNASDDVGWQWPALRWRRCLSHWVRRWKARGWPA